MRFRGSMLMVVRPLLEFGLGDVALADILKRLRALTLNPFTASRRS